MNTRCEDTSCWSYHVGPHTHRGRSRREIMGLEDGALRELTDEEERVAQLLNTADMRDVVAPYPSLRDAHPGMIPVWVN